MHIHGAWGRNREPIMKSHLSFVRVAIGIIAITGVATAEKERRADVSGYPFWSAPKRGHVAPFVPGLNAVLDITDAQKQQIAAAREEMLSDPAVQSARSMSKSDPKVTAEDRDKARAGIEAAEAKMHEKVAAVLTVEQKAIIENINGAYAEAAKQVGATYQVKFESVKVGPEERQRMQQSQREEVATLFQSKLDEMLSPAQKTAMESAAKKEGQKNTKVAGKEPSPKK